MENSTKLLWCVLVGVFVLVLLNIDFKNDPKPAPRIAQKFPTVVTETKVKERYQEASSYTEAFRLAEQQNKKVLLIFSATWCGPCRQMKSTTLANEQVKEEMTKYIIYKVDVDQERSIASKYNVSGVPYYCIVNTSERINRQTSGYMDSQKFIKWLQGEYVRGGGTSSRRRGGG